MRLNSFFVQLPILFLKFIQVQQILPFIAYFLRVRSLGFKKKNSQFKKGEQPFVDLRLEVVHTRVPVIYFGGRWFRLRHADVTFFQYHPLPFSCRPPIA